MKWELEKFSDEKLIEFIALGNGNAFAELVKRRASYFYRIAFGVTFSREMAQDVVQECLLKLWQSPQKFRVEKGVKFGSWFARVIKNRAIDELRKKKMKFVSQDFVLENDFADEGLNQFDLMEQKGENRNLDLAILGLQERQKTAIKLSFFEGLKNRESAQAMGLSLKAFQSLLLRAKKSLKINLHKNCHEKRS